jgi:hypothetical protein
MIKDDLKAKIEPFYLACYRFTYEVLEEVRFSSYKGAAFRGGFGHVLKEKACLLPGVDCRNCYLRDSCIYVNIFESPVPEGSKYFQGQSFAPHPFVIAPPPGNKEVYRQSESITFTLTLIGKAVNYLPYFIFAFYELGNRGLGLQKNGLRGRCQLETVESLSSIEGEALTTLYSRDKPGYMEPSILLNINTMLTDEISRGVRNSELVIFVVSPTTIKTDKIVSRNLDFKLLVRSILLRLSALSYLYCDFELNINYRQLLDLAGEVNVQEDKLIWINWDRYSGRQQQRFLAEGFVGEIVYKGDLKPFIPLIAIGQYLHLGKGTSHGQGKYIIASPADY